MKQKTTAEVIFDFLADEVISSVLSAWRGSMYLKNLKSEISVSLLKISNIVTKKLQLYK
jgi:hypothetical protein